MVSNSLLVEKPQATLCIIGNEVLSGSIQDKNFSFFLHVLRELNISLASSVILPDNETALFDMLSHLLERQNILILTGGLGPTDDDITIHVLSKVLNLPIIYDARVSKKVELFSRNQYKQNVPIQQKISLENYIEVNRKQARVLEASVVLPNPKGLSPGIWMPSSKVLALPGFPKENQAIWPYAIPYIKEYLKRTSKYDMMKSDPVKYSKSHSLWGITEGVFAGALQYNKKNWSINNFVLPYGIKVQVSPNISELDPGFKIEEEFNQLDSDIESLFGAHKILEPIDMIVDYLKAHQYTFGTIESCTGGLASKLITDKEGVSTVYRGSIVAYHNDVKNSLLDIPQDILNRFGAVSPEVAELLAKNGLKKIGCDICFSYTGIAGPGGGRADKPMGLVYMAIAHKPKNEIIILKCIYNLGRERFRQASVYTLFITFIQRYITEKWNDSLYIQNVYSIKTIA